MTHDSATLSYIYNADSLRTSLTNGTKIYNYVYNGSHLREVTIGATSKDVRIFRNKMIIEAV